MCQAELVEALPYRSSYMLSRLLLIFLITTFFASCVATRTAEQKEIRRLQKGKITEDTSYLYALPYEQGTAPRVVQGYFSPWSHKNRAAIDFKMKEGTKILAARDGIVVRMQESNNKGGWSRKYRQYANFLVVEHEDGTRAGYWHLQQNGALVNIGDRVKKGDIIALSGKTGYSAMPHLHFMVWGTRNGNWMQIPTRFQTSKGAKYLRPMRKYRK